MTRSILNTDFAEIEKRVMANEPTHYVVFVYGTLKQGYHNARVLGRGAEFLGKAVTCPRYQMIDVGCPVIIENEALYQDTYPVAGELYRIEAEALPRLDRLESEGRMYDRKVIECTLKGNETTTQSCSIYVGCAHWSQRHGRPVPPNPDGELEWTRPEVEALRAKMQGTRGGLVGIAGNDAVLGEQYD